MPLNCPESMAALARFFNGLSPEKLDQLGDVYSPKIEFQNPIHEAHGLTALRNIFERLFQQYTDLSIRVEDAHGDDHTGFLLWTMRYRFHKKTRSFHGTSHITFAPDGRVAAQQDHWDASQIVYGNMPIIGWAMRRMKRTRSV